MTSSFATNKALLAPSMLFAVLLGVAGCSGETQSYSSVEEVVSAFVESGGECSSSEPMNALNEDYGIFGVNCDSGAGVLWFETDGAKSDWLGLLEGTDEPYVEGPNWIVMTADTEMVTISMGGRAFN